MEWGKILIHLALKAASACAQPLTCSTTSAQYGLSLSTKTSTARSWTNKQDYLSFAPDLATLHVALLLLGFSRQKTWGVLKTPELQQEEVKRIRQSHRRTQMSR